MACLSPSPSGRRLSELLQEKQEPFLLDVHLLEKGCCSSRLHDTATCWPAPAAALKLVASGKCKASSSGGKMKKRQHKPADGILALLLSKVLRVRCMAVCSQEFRTAPALQFSDSVKLANAAPSPCEAYHLGGFGAVKTTELKEECSDSHSYSDDEIEKQLSPVSVLEHPFESSPAPGKLLSPSTKAMDVFRDLLDAAYSPALLTHLLAAKSADIVQSTTADEDEYYHGHRTRPKSDRYNDNVYREAEAHRAKELARVSALAASEVTTATLDAAQPEREDIGAGVADAVLHALVHELVVDLGGCC